MDEQPIDDPLDVSRMSREERDALKRRILAQHPELVNELRVLDGTPEGLNRSFRPVERQYARRAGRVLF